MLPLLWPESVVLPVRLVPRAQRYMLAVLHLMWQLVWQALVLPEPCALWQMLAVLHPVWLESALPV